MFTAKGGAVMKLPGGPYQVRVDFYVDDDDLERLILSRQYVVVDRPALLVQVNAQLHQLAQAEHDAHANMNIVGKKLGSI